MNLIDRLVVSVVGDTAALKKSLADSKKQLSGFGAAVQKHSAAFMKTGAVMMGFAGAIGIAAIKVGKEFDKAYSKIRTGTGKTGKVLEGLKKDFRAVVKDVPNSLDEVSTAIADLNTRLGLTGKPLQAMAKQMLNLARITETDVNAVIRTSTRLFGDWDVAVEDQAETLDYLYKVSQSTGVGIDKLSDMVTTYGVQLRTVGFTMEESLALMGKWEKEGVSAEKMLGGLSMALGKFAKAQKEPEEAFRLLVQNIEEATTVGKAMELGVEALGTRAGPDFALAVREGRFAVEDFVAELADSSETINQAAEDTMTLTEKFNLLKNQAKLAIEPLAKALMDDLMPALEKVTDKLGDLDEKQLENIASNILFATKILAVSAALIFATGVAGKVIAIAKTIATVWGKLGYILAGVGITGSTFAGIIGSIGTALLLTGDSVDKYETKAISVRKKIKEFSNTITEVNDNLRIGKNVQDDYAFATAELFRKVEEFPGLYDKLNPKLQEINRLYEEGKITKAEARAEIIALSKLTKEQIKDIEELTVAEEEGIEYTGRFSKEIYGWAGAINYATAEEIKAKVVHQENEAVLKSLMKQHNLTRGEAIKYAEAEGLLKKETEDTTESIEEQREAVEKLRGEFDDLIDTIFGHIITYDDFQEACWAVEEAEKAVAEAVKEHGIDSVEAMKAQNNLNDANIKAIKTAFELSTEIEATTEQQEEARKEAIKLGLQYVRTGEIGAKEFADMAAEFGMSAADILEYAEKNNIDINALYKDVADRSIGDFIEMCEAFGLSGQEIMDKAEEVGIDIIAQFREAMSSSIRDFILLAQQAGLSTDEIIEMARVMGIEIDEATIDRTITIGVDATGVPRAIQGVLDELGRIKDKTVKITTRQYYEALGMAKGGIAGFARGGIAGSDGFSLPLLTAAKGLITLPRAQEGMLAVLHPPELVLNPDQALRVLWRIANEPRGARPLKKPSINYEVNITTPEKLTESEIKRQIDMLSRELGYRMGLI
ncbi:hypothetical protein ES707_10662 [subsurface metagenome]